ncbi:hypothetical protein M427DRAFT_167221 [Gonapodya prolifera JEL478]|uniref:Uncharacterized protein n=1 Tax=Gonapodya prolifera (strain JEL478) TaxID=1344416 RepID=A0A139B072_GONPJ|nr:hypothetical protein M427DRAFT_167221 [Gonapodya prolifera JEL478]|eukprot:KXS22203.1 hypothetical protein M427DRAFT_167221 [Gonapodya prolifera JEL478]
MNNRRDGTVELRSIPPLASPGSKFYNEPFRWDQRLFAMCLIPPSADARPTDPRPEPSSELFEQAGDMASRTGGQMFAFTSWNSLLDCMVALNERRKPGLNVPPLFVKMGVEVKWEEIDGSGRGVGRPVLSLIYHDPQRRGAEHFPIPEPFWIDQDTTDSVNIRMRSALCTTRAMQLMSLSSHHALSTP